MGPHGGAIFHHFTKKYPKTRFLTKSIKIIRKNAILTKFPKVRCPKGRSTALFACQKYIFSYLLPFLAFFAQKIPQNPILSDFLKKIVPKRDFLEIFENTDPAGRPIDRSTDPNKNPGGLGGLFPPSKKLFFSGFY